MARPSLLTEKNAKDICTRLAVGVPRAFAGESVGIARRTMYLWLEYGRAADACTRADCTDEHHGPVNRTAKDPSYLQFLHDVTKAEADAVVSAQRVWTEGWTKDWHSARDWLATRHAGEYAQKMEVEHSGQITVDDAREVLKRKIDGIAERLLAQIPEPDKAKENGH